MTGIDRRLFVFGLYGVCLARTPVGRINSVFAATEISPDELIVVPIINRIVRAFTNVVIAIQLSLKGPDHIPKPKSCQSIGNL